MTLHKAGRSFHLVIYILHVTLTGSVFSSVLGLLELVPVFLFVSSLCSVGLSRSAETTMYTSMFSSIKKESRTHLSVVYSSIGYVSHEIDVNQILEKKSTDDIVSRNSPLTF